MPAGRCPRDMDLLRINTEARGLRMNGNHESSHLLDHDAQRARWTQVVVRQGDGIAGGEHLRGICINVALVARLPVAAMDENPKRPDATPIRMEQIEGLIQAGTIRDVIGVIWMDCAERGTLCALLGKHITHGYCCAARAHLP